MELPPIYAIANLEAGGLLHVERLLKAGAQVIQLRAKTLTSEELLVTASQAVRLRDQLSPEARIILNDRAELVEETGADGVHVGQGDLPPENARALIGPEGILGLSSHTLEQVQNAPFHLLDYLAFGPVFLSPTKSGHAEVTGLALLAEAARICPVPLVAIGGINAENTKQVFASGAASVAVISDLQGCHDLGQRISTYCEAARTARGVA